VQQAQVSVELQEAAAVGQASDVDRGEAESLDEGGEVRIDRGVVAGVKDYLPPLGMPGVRRDVSPGHSTERLDHVCARQVARDPLAPGQRADVSTSLKGGGGELIRSVHDGPACPVTNRGGDMGDRYKGDG
jgi:hypothetical protein